MQLKAFNGKSFFGEEDDYPRSSIQLSIRGVIHDKSEFTEKFMAISSELNLDIAFQETIFLEETDVLFVLI